MFDVCCGTRLHQVQYQRIVARKTIYNGCLRVIFYALMMAKLSGAAPGLSTRVITVPGTLLARGKSSVGRD